VVVVEFSLVGAAGPSSWLAEFDATTKLLLGWRQWANLERRGDPAFEARTITYSRELPDEVFAVDLPLDASHRLKDVTVADEMIGMLAMPDTGMDAPGLTVEAAAERIVGELWHAVLQRDLARFRRLCPVATLSSDELLKVMVGMVEGPSGVVELVKVGPAVRRGHSKLGPLTVVSSVARHRDGGLYQGKVIVQHRLTGATPSCVVYAGYGLSSYRLE
jgi:hypothetical protein